MILSRTAGRRVWVKMRNTLYEQMLSASPPNSDIARSGRDFALGPKIGIGGSLAAPPLPHHRTYGSVYGGSRSYANALRSKIRLVLAGRSGSLTAESDSMSSRPACRASPVGADEKSSLNWIFSRLSLSRFMSYLPLLSFGPSAIVSGSAYLLTPPFGAECLTSLADGMTYYALC